MKQSPLDLSRLKTLPLASRRSLAAVEEILVPLDRPPAAVSPAVRLRVREAAARLREAKSRGAQAILIYGAHLLRNGAALLVADLMERGWITHLATNGAGTIHDWEFAWLGCSTEGVEENVALGTFGTWEETGRNIHLALLGGALDRLGYGRALGRFIHEDGVTLPDPDVLAGIVAQFPADPLAA
ncbi:MAG: hypothetical protein EXS36_15890, partial [Pedosphaera sp.]|nr:hypothetical protein [Pedosphaera sp.]